MSNRFKLVNVLVFFCHLLISNHVSAQITRIKTRPELYAHKIVYPDSQIVDVWFSVLGNDEPKGILIRDATNTYQGNPVYQFTLAGGRRIELSTAYVSESMAAEHPIGFIDKLVKVQDVYRLAQLGEYGDVITYEWSVLFPKQLNDDSHGIVSQWHGRPDKTLTRDPEGMLKYNTLDEFIKLLEEMDISSEVDEGEGYDKTTGEKNGWRVDSYQRPIGELSVDNGYLYLTFRNYPNRLSGKDKDSPVPRPGVQPVPYTIKDGNVSATIVFERKLAEVPINKWLDLKLEVKYATYSKMADEVIEPGYLKFWIDGELVADWVGATGKNDVYGPYFQHGVYTGSSFNVHHSSYRFKVNGESWGPGPVRPEKSGCVVKKSRN